jgi:hypothetical protein
MGMICVRTECDVTQWQHLQVQRASTYRERNAAVAGSACTSDLSRVSPRVRPTAQQVGADLRVQLHPPPCTGVDDIPFAEPDTRRVRRFVACRTCEGGRAQVS